MNALKRQPSGNAFAFPSYYRGLHIRLRRFREAGCSKVPVPFSRHAMPKPLTIRRLKWLKRQDALVAYFWLRLNDWRVPCDADRLFLMSDVLRKIERKFYPALEEQN